MALTSFTVKNYRSFVDTTRIEIRPLTLLFGYNSAGKSALLRFLPIVAFATQPGADGPLNLRRSEAARSATFRDVRSRLNEGQLCFSVHWNDSSNPISFIEWKILELVGQRRQIVETMRIIDSDREIRIELELPESESSGSFSQYKVSMGTESERVHLEFDGLIPSLTPANAHFASRSFDGKFIERIGLRLRTMSTMIHWIGPLRARHLHPVPRSGQIKRLSQDGTGGGVVEMLDAHPDAATETSLWYEKTTQYRLELLATLAANEEVVAPMLSHVGTKAVQIRVVDTGEGMGQVLPVIALASMAKLRHLGESPILAIEQPELHLHPRAHAEIAAFFCEIAQKRAAQFLVETHSENILLRVQLAILAGDISPENVVVYWLRQLDDGASVAEKIVFDEFARPIDDKWPPGVFSEDVEQLRQIVIERRKKAAQ